MKATWIDPAPIRSTNGLRTSTRACVRLRSMIPGDELVRAGNDVAHVALEDLRPSLADPRFFDRDIFVIGKAFADLSPVMKRIHAAGHARIIVDICDNVFAPPEDGLRPFYQAMLPHADAVVASSEILKDALSPNLPVDVPVFAIPDSVENDRQPPDFDPVSGTIRLLWFGYPNNLPLLHGELAKLGSLAASLRVELTVVTAWHEAARALFPDHRDGIHIRRRDWSPQAMHDELRSCDVVIVPSDDSPARRTKSANRLITGLWAGKYVVAYPLPSYEPFGDYASISRDLVTGIEWAMENRREVLDRIGRGQDFIWQHYSPPIVAGLWKGVFNAVAEKGSRP